jgi:hypothetical protein
MVYPGNFSRLVIIGNLYADTFNTTLSIASRAGTGTIGLPTNDEVKTALAPLLEDWWNNSAASAGIGINAAAKLTGFKLNTIGPDGSYVNPVTVEHIYPSPIQGNYAVFGPAQLATVATLRTAVERGLASKGRMYLPFCEGFRDLGTDGRATTTDALRVANAVTSLINIVNGVYLAARSGDETIGRVSIASKSGAGLFREVTKVTVGRVPDTMRSRRNKLAEDPQGGAGVA